MNFSLKWKVFPKMYIYIIYMTINFNFRIYNIIAKLSRDYCLEHYDATSQLSNVEMQMIIQPSEIALTFILWFHLQI